MDEEVFLVMANRADKNIPGIEKTVGVGDGLPESDYVAMHLTEENAMDLANCLNKEIGPHYGVYRAVIRVTERVKHPNAS